MKLRNYTILILFVLIVSVLIYFGLFGIGFGIYKIDPLASQVNLGLDLTGGAYVVYEAQDAVGVEDLEGKMQGTMTVFRNRLDAKGFSEATIVQQGDDRIRVEVPFNSEDGKGADPNMISEVLGKAAKLEFKSPRGDVILDGDDVISTKAILDEKGQAVVAFELTNDAANDFADATSEFLGQSIGIFIDGIEISNPVVNSIITGGSGIIEGNFTPETARDLAIQIESGALPLEIREIEQRSISATLGVDALSKSIMAAGIGIAILFLFMIIYYRVPGVVASVALIVYMFIMLFLLAGIKSIQLTLPGIAGIILSIGMAVDANVIIFERFKEELRTGKTLRTSLKSGYHKAVRTILDANITTIIASIVLIIFGKGVIKSFGYTLTIGIIVSMFTALFVTRWLLRSAMGVGIKNKKAYCAGRIEE
jgi:preprotein translocase subunit SecD